VRLQTAHFDEATGIREMRKFYRWYLKSFEGIKKYRAALTSAETRAGILEIIERIREEDVNHGRGAAQTAS
jgi:tRNA-dihydrouridine synthase